MMDGTIVQDQDEWTFPGVLLKEVLQESDERFAIPSFSNLVDDFIGDPVVGTKEMTPLWLTRRGNALLAASLHPTSHQEWQPA
jgi:hypothetical protein